MNDDDRWERDVLKQVALESIREQRRARRWNIAFRLFIMAYLLFLLAMTPSCRFGFGDDGAIGPHTALVRVSGAIMDESPASAETILQGLTAAFEAPNVRGVVLKINSPGGSPVQAGIVYDEIRRLKAQYPEVPVYAVVGDMAASGAYYIAVAADRIYVDKASMVGSIGVLMNGFGFTGMMDKLGVERRLLIAGEHKGFLDPFSEPEPESVRHAQHMLNKIHEQFIDVVKEGRGDRLRPDPAIFSGLIWTGEESIELGLADELGNVGYVARQVIGHEEIVDYTPRLDFLSRVTERFGAAVVRAFELRATSLH